MLLFHRFMLLTTIALLVACGDGMSHKNVPKRIHQSEKDMSQSQLDTATFGSGCFWCTEAVFQMLDGVVSATSGYMGGAIENPTYKQICTGTTGHAEVVRIVYDSKIISYETLLEAFWSSHDPTTLNRQGNDVGTQYRSVIFYHTPTQKALAEEIKASLNSKKVFDDLIVTEITSAGVFYAAENYHQEYFDLNGSEPYCQFVIKPKLDKFKKVFSDRLKK